jgi:hypothetical protein
MSIDRLEPSGKVTWGQRPSNGTEGDIQRGQTCDFCMADHEWHLHYDNERNQPAESCPIIMDAMVGEHSYPAEDGPPEWGQDERGHWYCKEFRPCPCRVPR